MKRGGKCWAAKEDWNPEVPGSWPGLEPSCIIEALGHPASEGLRKLRPERREFGVKLVNAIEGRGIACMEGFEQYLLEEVFCHGFPEDPSIQNSYR